MATALSNVGDFLGLGNAPNILTGGATQNPDWNPSNLDAGTNAIISQQAAEGNLSNQDLINKQLAGTSSTMPSATGGAVAQQQAGLGGSDNAAVTAALNDRANRLYSSQYEQLQNQAAAGAPVQRAHMMNQAANALQQQQNVNDQLNRQQMAVTLQKEGMRNQIIGQLFQGGGAMAGTMAAKGSMPKELQGQFDAMNSPDNPSNPGNYTSDPSQPHNLTGDWQTPQSQSLGTGYENGFQYNPPGTDGNGYYGHQWMAPGNSGYGLGMTYNGSG